MPANSKRFISWSAVSSKPQAEKISLEEQHKLNQEHIAKHGGIEVAALVVPGESRDIVLFEEAMRRIEAYRLLKEAIDTKAFDVLIFLNLGRLGRDIALIMAVVRLCQRAGIALYATQSPPSSLEPSDTYIDTLMTALQAAGYQQEIAELKRRRRFGMIERIKQGDFPAAIPWPWLKRYNEDGSQYLVIDEAGAKALQFIAELYINDGLGTTEITKRLNEAGYTNPTGGAWTRVTISYIIRHAKRYAGLTEYNLRSADDTIESPSRWPAIWPEETALAILKEKRERLARSRVRAPHRFSQCVYCSICNIRMRAQEYTVKARKNYVYRGYRCEARHPLANVMEKVIIDVLRFELTQLAKLDDLADALPTVEDNSVTIANQLSEWQGRLQRLEDELDRADTAFTKGLMTPERYDRQVERIGKEMAAVKSTIGELGAALASIEPVEAQVGRLEEFVREGEAMLTHTDVRSANAFFRHHVEIWVSMGKVDKVRFV